MSGSALPLLLNAVHGLSGIGHVTLGHVVIPYESPATSLGMCHASRGKSKPGGGDGHYGWLIGTSNKLERLEIYKKSVRWYHGGNRCQQNGLYLNGSCHPCCRRHVRKFEEKGIGRQNAFERNATREMDPRGCLRCHPGRTSTCLASHPAPRNREPENRFASRFPWPSVSKTPCTSGQTEGRTKKGKLERCPEFDR